MSTTDTINALSNIAAEITAWRSAGRTIATVFRAHSHNSPSDNPAILADQVVKLIEHRDERAKRDADLISEMAGVAGVQRSDLLGWFREAAAMRRGLRGADE